MVDIRTIVAKGSPQMNGTPLVRIPMNGRENLQFIVKQVLDVGAYGVVFPFLSTKDQAWNAVQSMRYPARRTDPEEQQEPRGTRGSSPANATSSASGRTISLNTLWPWTAATSALPISMIRSTRRCWR